MPDDLDQVASGTPDNLPITGVRIAAQCLLHLQSQPVHAAAHVAPANRPPYPHPQGDRDHRRSRTSSTSRRVAAWTPSLTRTRYPPANPISITSPARAGAVPSGRSGSPSPAASKAQPVPLARPDSAAARRKPGWRSRRSAAPPPTPTSPVLTSLLRSLASKLPATTDAVAAACLCP